MRCSGALVIAALVCGSGCAISLDDDDRGRDQPDGGPPLVSGCAALSGTALGATGRVQSWTEGAATKVVADQLQTSAGEIVAAVFEAGTGDCLAGVPVNVASGLDVSPLGEGLSARVLSTFAGASERMAFVQTARGFDSEGIAVATWDGRNFVTGSEYLFTADRPAYGDASLVKDGFVYAYGCESSGFLEDSCYLARAPVLEAGVRAAWTFYRGAGDFGPEIDDAWPLFTGGGGLAVVERGDRVLVAYATPLGERITMRSGLGVSGPWSNPIEVARCELPTGGFCTAMAAHPQLDVDGEGLTLTYAIASFEALTVEQRGTRLVRVPTGALP